jgi:hypothetical protein
LQPWLKEQWCIPPKADAEFVCKMEDTLEVYKRDYDHKRPQVCMDEASKQLVSETRLPRPMQPGQPQIYDYEYERQGVVSLFMFFEPLSGWRHVKVSARRTKADWAYAIRELVDDYFPEAEVIVLVLDNLNTHVLSSLYQAFPPAEARRLATKLEIHYTPKHGGWLNMAEIELAVLTGQCLDRRMATQGFVNREVGAWERSRNRMQVKVDWRFTTEDARIKLKRLYPVLEPVVSQPPVKAKAG